MAKSSLAYNKMAEREAKEMQELPKNSLQQDLDARSDRERRLDRITQAMKILQQEKGEWDSSAADGIIDKSRIMSANYELLAQTRHCMHTFLYFRFDL